MRKWLKMIMFYVRVMPAWDLGACTSAEIDPESKDEVLWDGWPWTQEERSQWEKFFEHIAGCVLAIVDPDMANMEHAEFITWFISFHTVVANRLERIAEAGRCAARGAQRRRGRR